MGEIAREVNHWERTGRKIEKYGEPSKERLAKEVQDVIRGAIGIALYYGIIDDVNASINKSHADMTARR